MFEGLINNLIEDLQDALGGLFNGYYKKPYDETGISTDIAYQFYIVDNDASGNYIVSSPENKFGPTLFSKDFRLVIQHTGRIDTDLVIRKTLWVLNKYSANGIRYNEESKIIQDIEHKQKAKLDIPLMMFTFQLKKAIVLNECNDKISEYGC